MTIEIVSWKGNAINDATNYDSYLLDPVFAAAPAKAQMVQRSGRGPLYGTMDRPGTVLMVETFVNGASTAARRAELRQWFDPYDETPAKLVINGDEGNEQYVMAVCEAHYPVQDGAALSFISVLKVTGDEAWRKNSVTAPAAWNFTTTGATRAVTNNGEKDAYPIYKITPTSAKSGTNPFKRFLAVHWRGDAATSYPTDVANNALDTRPSATNFDSTAGDDIRLYIDGVLADFWLDGINTTTTKIWAILDWQKGQTATLKTALGTGSLETIDVNEDISGWGDSGILQIDNEFFLYTSKNDSLKRFFVGSRAAKGSTAASHSAAATVRWIQHDITVTYGSNTLVAHVSDDNYKPMPDLGLSTNTSWHYANFGEDDGLRPGQWTKGLEYLDWAFNYTANQNSNADPWTEIGVGRARVDTTLDPKFYVHNPCGITNANFQSGERYAGFGYLQNKAYIRSGINGPGEFLEAQLADMTANATWQSWSQNEALRSGSKYVGIELGYTSSGGGTDMYLEASTVTLTLDSSNTISLTIGAEEGNYSLEATLTNTSLPNQDAIAITFQMELNQTIAIDTWNGTVTYEKDTSNQYGAVERVGSPRLHWLRLKPGSNTLKFDDVGTAGMRVELEYEERYGA